MTDAQINLLALLLPPDQIGDVPGEPGFYPDLLLLIRRMIANMKSRGQRTSPQWYRWIDRIERVRADLSPHYVGSLSEDELNALLDAIFALN